jgi:hypothetical protein
MIGEDVDWSTGFGEMVRRVAEPYILVLLEDYLLSAPVDTEAIARLFGHMKEEGAACLRVMPVPGAPEADPGTGDVGELPRGMPYRVSLQAAIWRRADLLELLRPGETPWDFELRGTPRSDELEARFLGVVQGGLRPLPYFITGVCKGLWLRDALALCRREGIPVDGSARGVESRRDYLRRRGRWYWVTLGERVRR